MRIASIVLAGLPALLIADTYPRQPGIDALHYVFRITLDDATDEIAGEATLDLRFLRDGVGEIALDLVSLADGKGMTVAGITSAGAPVEYSHSSSRLRIRVAPPSQGGERRGFTITYHGIPANGMRIGLNRHKDRTFFSQNWPDLARHWIPCIDHPYDKASSEFFITAPARYQVVANGLLQEERDLGDGRRLTHWKQSVPIATWLYAVGVAQFSARHFGAVHGIPLQTWVYPQDRDDGVVTFDEPTRQALEFFYDRIGPYPYEKLTNVEAAGLKGGAEHASAIFYGESAVGPRPATSLVAHEIAHQWFGDSVTERDWDDVWLSEGFATYFTLLFSEHYEGRDAFVAGLQKSAQTVRTFEQKNPGIAVIHNNLADMRRVLNPLVYQKGGWVLHMLRALTGTDAFWAGIREYYRRYRDASASTDDFRTVMEEVSGADLKWFFDQWLRRAGSPAIEGGWRYDAGAKQVCIDLTQAQPGEEYRLPLEVAIHGLSGEPRIEKIEMRQKQQQFTITANAEPSAVVLDPRVSVLMEAKFARRASSP
jgi:aminopeptidase N